RGPPRSISRSASSSTRPSTAAPRTTLRHSTSDSSGCGSAMRDRYGSDVLAGDWRRPPRGRSTEAAAEPGLAAEAGATGFVGEGMRVERDLGTVELEDRRMRRKVFPLGPGFLLEGRPVVLVAPAPKAPTAPTRTASGSRIASDRRAKVALPSRIFV